MIQTSDQLTPRESLMLEYEREEARLGREFALAIKDKELALAKLEATWSIWLRIPLIIVRLPILVPWAMFFGTAYIISVYRDQPIDTARIWEHV